MAVITISRQVGSRGRELAERLARRLDYRLIDKELLARVAALAHVPVEQVAEFASGGGSAVERLLYAIARSLPGLDNAYKAYAEMETAAVPGHREYLFYGEDAERGDFADLSRDDALRYFETAIRELADRGDCILLGRGSQVLLADYPRSVHARVIASESFRVRTVAEREGLDEQEARETVVAEDRRRGDYLRDNYDRDPDDPQLYDVVFRADRLDIDRAVEFLREWAVAERVKHERELEGGD